MSGMASAALRQQCFAELPDSAEWTADGSAITPIRVLVADDNPDFAVSLSLLIRSLGYQVEFALDGLAAVKQVLAFKPHVIFLDIQMPVLDGYDVCRRVRRAWWGAGVAIVAVTGMGDETFRRCRQNAGFDFRLVKPVSLGTLEDLLAKCGARH